MHSNAPVEIADRISRKRGVTTAVAAIVFVGAQVLANPFFGDAPQTASRLSPQVLWAVNAVALLLLLATGGGLLRNRQIRALVNDEVSRSHYRTAIVAGYWVAMAAAMGLYILPAAATVSGRAAAYVVVTSSTFVALVTFSWLEHRAYRDA
jgi:hypothetical protein